MLISVSKRLAMSGNYFNKLTVNQLNNLNLQFSSTANVTQLLGRRNIALSSVNNNDNLRPKTGILLLNMGGPQNTDQVHDYLLRIMVNFITSLVMIKF
jgi:hypothetical protein